MNSISDLVEQLKEGSISKDEMLERIYSNSIQRSKIGSESEKREEFDSFSFHKNKEKFEDPSFSMMKLEMFLDRQNQWEFRKNLNQDILREQKLKNEEKECTFQPTTNYSPSKYSADTFKRLSRHKDMSRYTRIKQQIDYNKLQEELSSCTFEPTINSRSSHTVSRYRSESPKRSIQPAEPSFAPKVKGPAKHMTSAREYLRVSPFERLSKVKSVQEPEEETIKCHTPIIYSCGCSYSSKPFFERQALYEIMKYEKREAAEQIVNHKPIINDRSRKLVKKSFLERNKEMIEKKSRPKNDPQTYSFHPKITKMAKMRKYRSLAEMSSVEKKKFEKSEADPQSPCDQQFSSTKAYSSIKSKLQILNDPEGFIERLKQEQRRKDLELNYMREENLRKELEECTYQPAIIDAPGYIKQIARNMALLKSETHLKNSPVRPDWR